MESEEEEEDADRSHDQEDEKQKSTAAKEEDAGDADANEAAEQDEEEDEEDSSLDFLTPNQRRAARFSASSVQLDASAAEFSADGRAILVTMVRLHNAHGHRITHELLFVMHHFLLTFLLFSFVLCLFV